MTDIQEVKSTVPATRKVRPWKAVVIRVARNEAGEEIKKLLASAGTPDWTLAVDWSDVFPYWLIATINDEVIGCAQVVPAKPYGYIEFLCVKPDAKSSVRIVAAKKLFVGACQQLAALGSAYAFGFVDIRNKPVKNMLKKEGCLISREGHLTVKKL